ncbi:MAG TPA: hypothetical protein VLW86_00775 [Syntrophorhabdales bacterium]|nr:hypothetical protein [Syntrophorhabdales bacterium]
MGAIICLNCTEVLCEIEPSRSGRSGSGSMARCELEEEDDQVFYRCPTCGAKNIVVETRTPSGFPQLTVVACSVEQHKSGR